VARPNCQDIAKHLLAVSDDEYLALVRGGLESESAQSWLMVAVAYMTAVPMASATMESTKYDTLPTMNDVVMSIAYCVDKAQGDELQSRRFMWLFQAMLILNAKKYVGNSKYETAVAELWIYLARGCELLPQGLADIIIWTRDEKAYFDGIADGRDGVRYCLNHVIPKGLQKNSIIQSFAASKNLKFTLSIYH
jgi:hypothetical protein